MLQNIHSPQDLKKIPEKKLTSLAEEIRTKIIEVVGKNGGHLASNLGVEPKASAPKRETEKLNLDGSTPTIGAGMLSLNPEEDEFDGLSMGSNRVRMGIDIKKRDKRFFRIG